MSSRKTPQLIWLRPQPNERKPRLSREQITAAVLKIADSEGFEAVTMKRVASQLGCATMTLYYYVRNKADIVALMHDAILAEILIPDEQLPQNWREAVAAIARRTRDVLLAHPWSLISLNDAQMGPNAMRHVEQSLAALDGLDLDPHEKLALWGIVDNYVFGNALHTIESLHRAAAAKSNPKFGIEALEFGRQLLATGQFPRLNALYQKQPAPVQSAQDNRENTPLTKVIAAQFERGLNSLLDGLARRIKLDTKSPE